MLRLAAIIARGGLWAHRAARGLRTPPGAPPSEAESRQLQTSATNWLKPWPPQPKPEVVALGRNHPGRGFVGAVSAWLCRGGALSRGGLRGRAPLVPSLVDESPHPPVRQRNDDQHGSQQRGDDCERRMNQQADQKYLNRWTPQKEHGRRSVRKAAAPPEHRDDRRTKKRDHQDHEEQDFQHHLQTSAWHSLAVNWPAGQGHALDQVGGPGGTRAASDPGRHRRQAVTEGPVGE